MKRINNIHNKIANLKNIELADKNARKCKRSLYGVKVHDKNKDINLLNLYADLANGEYKTSKYKLGIIKEPKERLLFKLPYYPDRIAHHAIMNVLEPIWTKIYNKNTYSCIKNRGIHKLAKDLKELLRKDPEGTKYCLETDIVKFYHAIDHEILLDILKKKIKDLSTLNLLEEVIKSVDNNRQLHIKNYSVNL